MRSDDEKRILGLWPKYEDGSYVRLGDSYIDTDGDENEVMAIEFNDRCTDLVGLEGFHTGFDTLGERVKRPAPKVLDADGVEIKVGDRIYSIENGNSYIVRSVNGSGTLELEGFEYKGWSSKRFTHMQPAIDADGVPIKVDDTVWHEDGSELHVIGFCDMKDGKTMLTVEYAAEPTKWGEVCCLSVTHTRPDSWEQLEEDIAKYPCRYAEEVKGSKFNSCSECPWHSEVMARDIVRRAKALAEKVVEE